MPVTFMTLLLAGEFYLLAKSGRYMYALTIFVFYGYLSFNLVVFTWLTRYALTDLKMKKYGCISLKWNVLVQLFPMLVETLVGEMSFLCHAIIAMHAILVFYFMNRRVRLQTP
jgi:hypothetical protein